MWRPVSGSASSAASAKAKCPRERTRLAWRKGRHCQSDSSLPNGKDKGRDLRHALVFASAPRSIQPSNIGFKVVAALPHQAHQNELAGTTANILGNNRIVMPWAENLPQSGARKRTQ